MKKNIKTLLKLILSPIGLYLKKLIKYFSGSHYVEFTEIPEHIRLRDVFFKKLEKYYAK